MYRGRKSDNDRYNRAVPGTKMPWTYNASAADSSGSARSIAVEGDHHVLPAPDLAPRRAFINGVPVPVVSALLGHKSMKMVDEHYNHTDQMTGELREAAAKNSRTDNDSD